VAEPQAAACRIFVREIGSGIPVVMLHGGWGGEHESLLHDWLILADDHRLVFYDQRGSFCSPCDALPTAADHRADLEALRETLGEERVVLLGHSNGGWLAQAHAAAHPDRVAGMVLVDPVPARSDLSAWSGETRWERPEVLGELERHGLVLPRRPDDSVQE
jgi:proline iminopeptidase